jgi:tRNA (mo5U34)-methyltransferase
MSIKNEIYATATKIREKRSVWFEQISKEKIFIDAGGAIYPYDTTAANLDPIFSLFEKSGLIDLIENRKIRTICDVGCANGDLSFSFAASGFAVTAIDYTLNHDQAPYVVSRVAALGNFPVAVVDMSIDTHFSFNDLVKNKLSSSTSNLPLGQHYDLAICLGLLYHLKNPFAFLESLFKIAEYVVIGTHIMTHPPALEFNAAALPMAYLVNPNELNNDPTNFWILTNEAFKRLAERCGFEILANVVIPNNELGLAVPDRIDLGIRSFLLLKRPEILKS